LAAANFTVQPHDATGSAARSAIAFHVRSLISQVPAAQKGEAEPVHQVRVAARRLRSAVRLFAAYISAIKPKETDARLKWLGQQAGAVRDLDVLEKLMQKRAKNLDPLIGKDLEPLFEEIRVRRAKAAQNLATSLASRRYKALVARLSAPIAITTQGDAAFGSVAAELFAPMLKSMMRAGQKIHEKPTAEDLHRLRKRAKGSRYALETMLAIDEKQLGGMLKSLEDLQDLVGGYHDAVVAIAWIREFVASRELPANVAFACGALAQAIARGERKLKRRGLKEWNRFAKTDPDRIIKKALEKVQPKGVSSDDAVHHAPRPRRRAHA
jgi:CHAD domain-containing protein